MQSSNNKKGRNDNDDSQPHSSKQATSSPLSLIICASGICGCYLYFGILQERLFSKGGSNNTIVQEVTGGGSITTFMLLLSCMTNVGVAFLWSAVYSFFLDPRRDSRRTMTPRNSRRQGWWWRWSSSCSHEEQKKEESDAVKRREKASLGRETNRKPLHHGLLLANAFTYFAAMTASNEALGYVSYPTAVLAKSSKLIPTMIVGSVIDRKSFKIQEWWSAMLITGGITIFNLSRLSARYSHGHHGTAGNHGTADDDDDGDSMFGLFLLMLSLAMDGLLASCQDLLKKTTNDRKYKYRPPSALETMLWVNAYAILFLLPLSWYNGQFANGIKLFIRSPPKPQAKKSAVLSWLNHATRNVMNKIFRGKGIATKAQQAAKRGKGLVGKASSGTLSLPWSIALLNLTAAGGQIFIFLTIQMFSPLTCTTITTTRKFFTMLLSVWSFGHVLTPIQWMAIGMVFGGLYLAILSKFTSSKTLLGTTTCTTKEEKEGHYFVQTRTTANSTPSTSSSRVKKDI